MDGVYLKLNEKGSTNHFGNYTTLHELLSEAVCRQPRFAFTRQEPICNVRAIQ